MADMVQVLHLHNVLMQDLTPAVVSMITTETNNERMFCAISDSV